MTDGKWSAQTSKTVPGAVELTRADDYGQHRWTLPPRQARALARLLLSAAWDAEKRGAKAKEGA